MQCNECGVHTCIKHGVPHSGETCLQYDVRRAGGRDGASEQYIRQHTQKCPGCRHGIEKNGGCDHMTCVRAAGGCGHEFWFKCGCDYKKTHTCGKG